MEDLNYNICNLHANKMIRVSKRKKTQVRWGVHFIEAKNPTNIRCTKSYIGKQVELANALTKDPILAKNDTDSPAPAAPGSKTAAAPAGSATSSAAPGSKTGGQAAPAGSAHAPVKDETGCTLSSLLAHKWSIAAIYRTKLRGCPNCIDGLKFFNRGMVDSIDVRSSWTCHRKFYTHLPRIKNTLLHQSNFPNDLKELISNARPFEEFDDPSDDERPFLDFILNSKNVVPIPIEQDPRPFKCHLCPKDYKSAGNLRDHSFEHLNMSYPCPECKKNFTAPHYLFSHLKMHSKKEDQKFNLTKRNENAERRKRLLLSHSPDLIAWTKDQFERASGEKIKVSEAYSLYVQRWGIESSKLMNRKAFGRYLTLVFPDLIRRSAGKKLGYYYFGLKLKYN